METLLNHADIASYGGSLLLKAGLVLGAAWIVAAFLRRRSAGLRHMLWSLAFGAVLALPVISAWVPPLEVDLSQLESFSRSFFAPGDDSVGRSLDLAAGSNAAKEPVALSTHRPGLDLRATAPDRTDPRPLYILLVWAAGAVLLSAVFAVDLARIRRARTRAVDDARVRRAGRRVAAELKLLRSPRVLLGQVDVPVTWGLFRPVVLLPVESMEWSDRRLRIVLMHELAHVRRLDYLPHLLAELACLVYWPNPLVWMARHRLRREQELACDDFVLRTGTASHDYAELLLDIARTVRRRATLMPGAVGMAERGGLKARIRAILDPNVERRTVSLLAFLAVLAAVAVPALSTAALRSADSDERASDTARHALEGVVGDPARSPETVGSGPAPDDRRGSDESAAPSEDVTAFRPARTLMLEAESGRLTAPMAVHDDSEASGGRYVVVPDQDGHDPPEGGPGRVAFEFEMEGDSARAVWARVIGDEDNDNSFFVSVDGEGEFRWDLTDRDGDEIDDWTWLPVVDRSGRLLRLDPGSHTLVFRNREDGSRLDAVFLTSDPGMIPRGRSPLPPPEISISIALEAEQPAALVAPMEIRADDRASGRLYVSVADGHDSRRSAPEDGRARYVIDVPESGRYVVWGRVLAPDDDDDSFWIRVNEGAWIRWNGIEESDDWEWQLVHDSGDHDETAVFSLDAGIHTLEIAYREDGAGLDRLVVTNNVYVHPSVSGQPESRVSVTFAE